MSGSDLLRRACVLAGACLVTLALAQSPALAATAAQPGWTLSIETLPTNMSAGENSLCEAEPAGSRLDTGYKGISDCDSYQVTATNAGSEPTSGEEMTLTDVLPKGVTVQKTSNAAQPDAALGLGGVEARGGRQLEGECKLTVVAEVGTVTCRVPGVVVLPGQYLQLTIGLLVSESAAGSLTDAATVSGGGAPSVSAEQTSAVSSTPAPFGPATFGFMLSGLNGLPERQAGGHPYELTVSIGLNNDIVSAPEFSSKLSASSAQPVKDIIVDLPLGFAASDLAAPQCTFAQLDSDEGCPRESVVGYLETAPGITAAVESPIWNLVPERGLAGEFAFHDKLGGTHILYARVVPTPQGYVIQSVTPDIASITMSHITATFYGDPAVRDDLTRPQVPYFTDPTDCEGSPPTASIMMDSWQDPGTYNADGTPNLKDPAWKTMSASLPAVTGCDLLRFEPSLLTLPTDLVADSPTGLEFEMKLPQPEQFDEVSTPDLDNATVTFPEGMTVDPSSGQGLEACSAQQIGWEGGTPENFNDSPPACPEASKIGTLELETPLIPGKLEGQIYLAAQNENPFGSVFAIYVVVNDPTTGVVLKIAGELRSDPQTGRLTGYFPENAQLPFSALKLHFFGGPRAELATPEACGTYTTTSVMEPWSAPDSGPVATPSSSFTIGEGCVDGFAPTFVAGTTNLQAGAFTSFAASFSRSDKDEKMSGLSVTLPPGLLADVGSVPECGEAQIREAEAGTGGCPESTRVGTVTAGAGPGPNPLFVTGKAYWTGPYKGAPFGMVVVVPAIAGPFHLGNVVVRQALYINPLTAQATDVSDPFPRFLDPVGANGQKAGIPIDLRRVDVAIDREDFAFNPTSCEHMKVTGSMSSVGGASQALEAPFQVANCAALAFNPTFKVSTSAKTSKKNGASLHASVTYPKETIGKDANLKYVKVELPKALPSQLETLKHACLESVFNANPAGCPVGSVVGSAIVHTPVLPGPLQGPAYFVSHGGKEFPSLTIVLQGDGVTVEVVGETYISKGVTSSTFSSTPDVPFESFELTLPEGANAALAANGNLCDQKLVMPTRLIGQNGVALQQQTRIAVEGCPAGLQVLSKKIEGRTLTLRVVAPSAGTLKASGKGLSSASESASGREPLRLVVHVNARAGASGTVRLVFKPTQGKDLSKVLLLSLKRG